MSGYAVVVECDVRADAGDDAVRLFNGPFKDAIAAQDGFRSVTWLKPVDGQSHLLLILFSEQALQERWVSSDLHAEVWSALEATFSGYRARSFHAA